MCISRCVSRSICWEYYVGVLVGVLCWCVSRSIVVLVGVLVGQLTY